MRYFSQRVLLFVILTSISVKCEGATLITATNRLPDPPFAIPVFHYSGGGSDERLAQTFTAEVSGQLLSVSMTIASVDPDPTGLQLAVTVLEDGMPGPILATSPLQGLYTNGLFSDVEVLNAVANFDDNQIILEAQRQYALLFVAVRDPSSFTIFGSQSNGPEPESAYAGGEILRSRGDDPFQSLPIDLLFEVTVETIPEPMTLSSALIFAVAALGRRRCRTP